MKGWSWTYVLIMAGAIVMAYLVSRIQRSLIAETESSFSKLSLKDRVAIALGAFCGGTIGAKLPFVLLDWSNLVSGSAWFDNGKTILFGLVGGYFGVEIVKWCRGITIKTGDSLAAPAAAAIAVGRWACFSAGCCYGTETKLPWGVNFGDQLYRHPTQIYEFFFHAACACLLLILRSHGWFRRQLVKLYFLAYLAYRFLTEFIRPEPIGFGGLTFYQWSALLIAPIFLALWVYDRKNRA